MGGACRREVAGVAAGGGSGWLGQLTQSFLSLSPLLLLFLIPVAHNQRFSGFLSARAPAGASLLWGKVARYSDSGSPCILKLALVCSSSVESASRMCQLKLLRMSRLQGMASCCLKRGFEVLKSWLRGVEIVVGQWHNPSMCTVEQWEPSRNVAPPAFFPPPPPSLRPSALPFAVQRSEHVKAHSFFATASNPPSLARSLARLSARARATGVTSKFAPPKGPCLAVAVVRLGPTRAECLTCLQHAAIVLINLIC